MRDVTATVGPRQPLPERLESNLVTLGSLPPGREEQRWAFEMKGVGVRALAGVQVETVRLISRNDVDMRASYPELDPVGGTVAERQLLLDGEIVNF